VGLKEMKIERLIERGDGKKSVEDFTRTHSVLSKRVNLGQGDPRTPRGKRGQELLPPGRFTLLLPRVDNKSAETLFRPASEGDDPGRNNRRAEGETVFHL